MTDDTLREECEAKVEELLTFIEAASHRKLTFQTVVNLKTGEQQSAVARMTGWLLTFARAQQAKGMMGCKTLRDEFAMSALTGMLAYSYVNPSWGNFVENCNVEQAAQTAYAYADAMLKVRNEVQP